MRKQLVTPCSIILSVILFLAGCKKDIKEQATTSETETLSRGSHDDNKNGCRLTAYDYNDAIAGFHGIDYYTYKKGRVDEWAVYFWGLYKMEYDFNGRLKKARVYDGDVLEDIIHFFYKKDKVVKEIWYEGNTDQVDDIVYYTYNRKGQMIKNESINYDYYATYTYHADGNLASWKVYIGGSPSAKGEYIYFNHIKNPLKLRPGIEHYFAYTNPAFGTFDNWYSSEKVTVYDEAGVPSVYYDFDPRKSRVRSGHQNYARHVDYVDRITGTPFTVDFQYENCGENNNNYSGRHSYKKSSSPENKNVSTLINRVSAIRSILCGPKKELKQKVNELRKEMKKK